MRNTKNKYKYKSYSNKSANINHQYFRNKLDEAKKLYIPQYNNSIGKTKTDIYKNNENNYNIGSSKKYLKFKQILNNYMNDYEKLKKQNKLPEYEEKNYYSYQEFEIEKNNVRELFDSMIDLNGHDEFNDTDKIIQNLPDDFDNMFLKNDATKKDYALRYEIINGEKLEETTERLRSKTENNINLDINKLNQNCLLENNEEDENDENNNININKQNEIKNDNIIEDNNNINNDIKINKDEEININNNINQEVEELNNNNNIIENNNKIEEEEKNNSENNNEEISKEQNNNEETSKEINDNNNINEQYTSNNNNINELNGENNIEEEKNTDDKNKEEEKKGNEEEKKKNEEEKEEKEEKEEENNINNEEKKEIENEVGQNKFKRFRESEEKEVSEDKDKKEESLEKYDDFE